MTNKKSILFIVNPISGTMNKDLIVKDIEALIDKDLFSAAQEIINSRKQVKNKRPTKAVRRNKKKT